MLEFYVSIHMDNEVFAEGGQPQFSATGSRGLPGSKVLSFASPKESNQRKGDPGSSPRKGAGFPALLAGEGGCGTRRTKKYVVFCIGGDVLLKQSSPNAPSPAALLGDSQREWCLRLLRLNWGSGVVWRIKQLGHRTKSGEGGDYLPFPGFSPGPKLVLATVIA